MQAVAETWRRVWGGGKNFRGPKFLNVFWGKIFPFSRPKFWWPFFSHRPSFSDFYSLFSDSPYLYCAKCRRAYMTLSSQKSTISEKNCLTPISLLCSSFRAHPATLLLKILGGPLNGPSPNLKFWGTVPNGSPPLCARLYERKTSANGFGSWIKFQCFSILQPRQQLVILL